MSQVSQLASTLADIYAETKRKNTDVRKAIEIAQKEAKIVPGSVPIASLPSSSSALLCAPLILGIDCKNAKIVASSMSAILSLVSRASMPEKAARDALACLHTNMPSLALEMSLKTLQMLPMFVANYNVSREDFSLVLAVAAPLLNGSSAVVSNTAAATLHQIFSSLFDKLGNETAVPGDVSDDSEVVWMCSHVARDLCSALEGRPAEYFGAEVRFSPEFALDILENIVHVNSRHLLHPRLLSVLKSDLCPELLSLAQTKAAHFPTFARCLKLLLSLTQFAELGSENAAFLSFTNRLVSSSLLWQRVVVLELYGSILSDISRVHILYEQDPSLLGYIFAALALSVQDSYVVDGIALFQDKICIPAENGPVLGKEASLKMQIVDHVEKSEPPTIPDLYVPNIVLNGVLGFAHAVSKFVSALSSENVNPETLEADVEFVTSLNEAIFPQISVLFRRFIFSCMSLDYFHSSVRYLQRYTHSIGLLGLSSQRDEVLELLAGCIRMECVQDTPIAVPNTNLLGLGGSIVESLSSSIQGATEKEKKRAESAPRCFNSRQVLCLRALTNLATSLGSTLHQSWDVILVAFQWAEYFINGAENGALGRKYDADSSLSTNELDGIENSKLRFYGNVAQYQESSLTELVQALVKLYEAEEGCPYNKTFFLNMVTKIAKLPFSSFTFYDSKVRETILDFFCRISTDRASSYESRAYIVECFTEIVVQVTKNGFVEYPDSAEVLAQKSASAFSHFLSRLLALGTPKEYLVLNCETEMHLAILTTLHALIDGYDKYYQNSWETVFSILNTAFVKSDGENKNLEEKISRLISTSFETLKLILDEFTSSLPFNQFKSLIDALMNFCSQTHDLNISFSAVSYFWLISDCINSEAKSVEQATELEKISNHKQLERFLDSADGSPVSYQALTIYLLAQLSTLSNDFRDQVREGAIQTLFQILDVRGKQLYSWELIYDVVFPPLLEVSASESMSRKSLVDSYNLMFSGLVSVYSKYMMGFDNSDVQKPDVVQKFWRKMVSHLSSALQHHWNELDLTVFQSFRDLLMLLSQAENVPRPILELLFEFWASVSINYDFVHPEYQETLAVYNKTFKILHSQMKELNMAQASRAMMVMNKCVKYPVLKASASDEVRPTNLQKAVLENLESVLSASSKSDICALVIQQLAEISVFPYGIKSRIEKKLESKFEGKLRIPSFVAISQLSIDLVAKSLHKLPHMQELVDGQFLLGRIIRSLLEAVYHQNDETPGAGALWVKSNEIMCALVLQLMDAHVTGLEEKHQVWGLLVECLLANLSGNNGDYNVKQYEKLACKILPAFFNTGHHDLIRHFVTQVYLQSYVYEANEVEKELMQSGEGYARLSQFRFEDSFGSTQSCQVKENREIRLKCLSELFEFPKEGGFSSQVTKEMLLTRVAFTLRRFIADERLLGCRPLPEIQEQELLIILEGFLQVAPDFDQEKLQGIMRLVSRGIEYCERVAGIEAPMNALLALS